jgi:hypothetical protein
LRGDISAVVLTLGEPHTERALASLARQTLQPAETIVVQGVSPFHRALNAGARRVQTPYFVQVDADMILNDWCLEELHHHMTPSVGMVVGPLADPLMGIEIGVKLFRRHCFEIARVQDTVSPDTDFNATLRSRGWDVVYALPSPDHEDSPTPWPTMGAHCPPYTRLHTYARYHLLGARYAYRRDFPAFRWRYRKLAVSHNPTAFIARIALGHGLFLRADGDLLTPALYSSSPEFEVLDRFLSSSRTDGPPADEILALLDAEAFSVFEACSRLAMALRRGQESISFRKYHEALDAVDHANVWTARAALAHGLFLEPDGAADIATEFGVVRDFLAGADVTEGDPPR